MWSYQDRSEDGFLFFPWCHLLTALSFVLLCKANLFKKFKRNCFSLCNDKTEECKFTAELTHVVCYGERVCLEKDRHNHKWNHKFREKYMAARFNDSMRGRGCNLFWSQITAQILDYTISPHSSWIFTTSPAFSHNLRQLFYCSEVSFPWPTLQHYAWQVYSLVPSEEIFILCIVSLSDCRFHLL